VWSWALRGGEPLPGRRITAGGRRKVATMSQVFSSIPWIYFLKTSSSNTGAPNLLLAPGAIYPRNFSGCGGSYNKL